MCESAYASDELSRSRFCAGLDACYNTAYVEQCFVGRDDCGVFGLETGILLLKLIHVAARLRLRRLQLLNACMQTADFLLLVGNVLLVPFDQLLSQC